MVRSELKWMCGVWLSLACVHAGCAASPPPIPPQPAEPALLALEGAPTGPALFDECRRGRSGGGVSLQCEGEYLIKVGLVPRDVGARGMIEESANPVEVREVRIALEGQDAPGFGYEGDVFDDDTGALLGRQRGLMMQLPYDEDDAAVLIYDCSRFQHAAEPERDLEGECLDYLASAHATPIEQLAGANQAMLAGRIVPLGEGCSAQRPDEIRCGREVVSWEVYESINDASRARLRGDEGLGHKLVSQGARVLSESITPCDVLGQRLECRLRSLVYPGMGWLHVYDVVVAHEGSLILLTCSRFLKSASREPITCSGLLTPLM